MSPYPERTMQIAAAAQMPTEFRAYASLYREALNSNTPVFQFPEATSKSWRASVCAASVSSRRQKNAGKPLPTPPIQVVPEKPEDSSRGSGPFTTSGNTGTSSCLRASSFRGASGSTVFSPKISGRSVTASRMPVLDSGRAHTLRADEEMDTRARSTSGCRSRSASFATCSRAISPTNSSRISTQRETSSRRNRTMGPPVPNDAEPRAASLRASVLASWVHGDGRERRTLCG